MQNYLLFHDLKYSWLPEETFLIFLFNNYVTVLYTLSCTVAVQMYISIIKSCLNGMQNLYVLFDFCRYNEQKGKISMGALLEDGDLWRILQFTAAHSQWLLQGMVVFWNPSYFKTTVLVLNELKKGCPWKLSKY